MCLYLSYSHVFELKLGGGCGSNTRAELIALWGLLFFASSKGVFHLMVLGDSKIIIDWIIGRTRLKFINMGWRQKIVCALQEGFMDL